MGRVGTAFISQPQWAAALVCDRTALRRLAVRIPTSAVGSAYLPRESLTMTCRCTAFVTAWREVSRISLPESAIPPHRVIVLTTISLEFMKQGWRVGQFVAFGYAQAATPTGCEATSAKRA